MSGKHPRRIPKYRLHKPSQLSVVRLNGRDHYLGPYGSSESHKLYKKLLAEWLKESPETVEQLQLPTEPTVAASDLTIAELLLEYMAHARLYYVKNGKPTGEVSCLRESIKPLGEMYGVTRASEFGPVALKRVRESFIESDISRGVINSRINRIRRIFKWAVENQRVEPSVLHGLQAVAALKRGRSNARDLL